MRLTPVQLYDARSTMIDGIRHMHREHGCPAVTTDAAESVIATALDAYERVAMLLEMAETQGGRLTRADLRHALYGEE